MYSFEYAVSIVSIQADQSRPGVSAHNAKRFAKRFQSYQFRQINPDKTILKEGKCIVNIGFNRINSGRSIQTIPVEIWSVPYKGVSIVSIQADQSRLENIFDNVEI